MEEKKKLKKFEGAGMEVISLGKRISTSECSTCNTAVCIDDTCDDCSKDTCSTNTCTSGVECTSYTCDDLSVSGCSSCDECDDDSYCIDCTCYEKDLTCDLNCSCDYGDCDTVG